MSHSVPTPGNWHPFGLGSFASDTKGILQSVGGSQTFALTSDDGAQLFIDGSLAVDDGGAHGVNAVSNTITLSAGPHAFELQFFECCGGESGLDLTIPGGDTISSVPLPAALPLMGGALGMGLFVSKWRRSPRGEVREARG